MGLVGIFHEQSIRMGCTSRDGHLPSDVPAERELSDTEEQTVPPVHLVGLKIRGSFIPPRHAHVTHLLSHGTQLATVSERLGHKDPATTLKIYSHALPTNSKRAAETWDKISIDTKAAATIITETSNDRG